MDVIKLSKTFEMLRSPLRLRILIQLATSEKLLVNTLATGLGVRGSVVSHHLKLMEGYGVVQRIPAGRYAFYRISPERLVEARRFLKGVGKGW